MKWTKKHTMITLFVATILIFAAAFYKLVIKPKPSTGNMTWKDIFEAVKRAYGYETAKITEKVIRLESRHFRSGLCKETNNYGNIMPGNYSGIYNLTYPYGWASLSGWWRENPNYSPTGYYKSKENGLYYLTFSTPLASAMNTAKILHLRGNDPGLYYGEYQPDVDEYRQNVADTANQYIL